MTSEISAAETYAETLFRIRSGDKALNAFVHIATPAQDAGVPRPELPLSGLPVAIKDLIDTADFPTGYGSAIYQGHRPSTDAAIVAALKKAGARIVGKTTTTEFATWPPTKTVNPKNPLHTPGGSSSGSAAAVGAGLVPVAFGSQTKGSVIRPASYCGVVGFKPSFNRFSRAGVKMLSESLDTLGMFASNVALARRVYEVITNDVSVPEVRSPRLAFCRTAQWGEVEAGAQAVLEEGIAQLRRTGLVIEEMALPPAFAEIPAQAGIVHDYEMHRSLLPELLFARDLMEPSLARALEAAAKLTAQDYANALQFIAARRAEFPQVLGRYDAILCAAAPGEAPLGFSSTGSPIMNISWTALYAPCISLPHFVGATGLPIGLQVVGHPYKDVQLLSFAADLERLLKESCHVHPA
jgi:amidase